MASDSVPAVGFLPGVSALDSLNGLWIWPRSSIRPHLSIGPSGASLYATGMSQLVRQEGFCSACLGWHSQELKSCITHLRAKHTWRPDWLLDLQSQVYINVVEDFLPLEPVCCSFLPIRRLAKAVAVHMSGYYVVSDCPLNQASSIWRSLLIIYTSSWMGE